MNFDGHFIAPICMLCAVVGLCVGKPRNVGGKGWHCTNYEVCDSLSRASAGVFQMGRGLSLMPTIEHNDLGLVSVKFVNTELHYETRYFKIKNSEAWDCI